MPALLFASLGAMQGLSEGLESEGFQPLPRNPQYFKASEIEPADLVVVLDGVPNQDAIIAAFEAAGTPTRVVSGDIKPFDVDTADKASLIDYAREHFGRSLDRRQGEDKIRDQVKALIAEQE